MTVTKIAKTNSSECEAILSVLGRDKYNIFDSCFDLMDQGIDQDGLIAYLHTEGATVTEAVLIMMKLYGLRMDNAGTAIAIHPTWQTDIQVFAGQSVAAAEWVRNWRVSATAI